MRRELGTENLIFSPSSCAKGALYDNLHPSRIVVGNSERGTTICKPTARGAIKQDIPVLLTGSTEAEAIKLFCQYLSSYAGGLFQRAGCTYAQSHGLDSRQIIEGIGLIHASVATTTLVMVVTVCQRMSLLLANYKPSA